MNYPEVLEFGSSVRLIWAPAEDVPFVPLSEDADLGWESATARIQANSLRMNAIAEGNKQADMPGWMAGSIDALHTNIGREHGFGLRDDKTSLVFHDSPASSSQGDLESIAEDPVRIYLDREGKGTLLNGYLYKYGVVRDVGTTLVTSDYFDFEYEEKKAG